MYGIHCFRYFSFFLDKTEPHELVTTRSETNTRKYNHPCLVKQILTEFHGTKVYEVLRNLGPNEHATFGGIDMP